MESSSSLHVNDLTYSIGSTRILDRVCLDLKGPALVGIMGPNGCGKSTLLQCITHYLKPSQGTVKINEANVGCLSNQERSEIISWVPQESFGLSGFSVEQFIRMGIGISKNDCEDYLETLMVSLGLDSLKDREISSLSGGERQRAIFAQSLLQNPKVLLLDEITNHLDMKYQIEILKAIKVLPMLTLAVIHDISLAARYLDLVVLLKEGRLVAVGSPAEIFSTRVSLMCLIFKSIPASSEGWFRFL